MEQLDKRVFTMRKANEENPEKYVGVVKLGLISKRRGKLSPNRISPEIKQGVSEILKQKERLIPLPSLDQKISFFNRIKALEEKRNQIEQIYVHGRFP